jgi:hypothetical protein
LLDELNLAPQSVLEVWLLLFFIEWFHKLMIFLLSSSCKFICDDLMINSRQGLNSLLDHRAEVFIPELGRTFKCPPSFRVFACQNPSSQGGGRKGLPKSFLNRFTKVGFLSFIISFIVENSQ